MTIAKTLSPIDAPPTGRLTVTRRTPVIGAEIDGVGLRQTIDRAKLHHAVRDHGGFPRVMHRVRAAA